jgi:glutathione S-transferase
LAEFLSDIRGEHSGAHREVHRRTGIRAIRGTIMKLYYSDLLSARKACAVARYLKAPVEFIYLDPAKGEFKAPAYVALNPNAKVPTLVKGERVTWEADAIMCQLSDDMGAGLWPHDARQIDIVRWFSWNAQHFTRAGGALYFENIIKKRFNIGAPDPKAVEGWLAIRLPSPISPWQ